MAAASKILFTKKVGYGDVWCKPVLIFAIILTRIKKFFSGGFLGCLAADKGRSDKVLPFQNKCLGSGPQSQPPSIHACTVNVKKETRFSFFAENIWCFFLVEMNGKFVSIGEMSPRYAEIFRGEFRFLP